MNKQDAEQREISIHWWNMGSKKLDYKGTAIGYLKKRDIKVSAITHPFNKETKGWRFSMCTSSKVTLDTFSPDYVECIDQAIIQFLTMMGDKTVYHSPYGREYKINWR